MQTRSDLFQQRGIEGLYEQSVEERAQGFAWMGREVTFWLPSGRGKRLYVEGFFDKEHHAGAEGGDGPITLSLEGAAGARTTIEITEAGAFRLDENLSMLFPPRWLILRASDVFVPYEIGESDDRRELSVIIFRVVADDVVIADFRDEWDPDVFAGFYPQSDAERERGGAWMGRTSRCPLAPSLGGTVRIEGDVDIGSHRKMRGNAVVTLTVGEPGEEGTTLILDGSGSFEIEHYLGRSPVVPRVRLVSDRVFRPKDIGVGEDARELALRLTHIRVDDRVVMDLRSSHDVAQQKDLLLRGGLNIVGYVRTESGVGESARVAVKCADAADLGVAVVDCSDLSVGRASDFSIVARTESHNPYRVNVFHVNADQTIFVKEALGLQFYEGRYNIGFWAWELSEFPKQWLPAFEVVDEVWCPSQFIVDAVAKRSPVPVVRIPHAIDFSVPENVSRKYFGLPEDLFLFLVMYDFRSVHARKNPEAAIEAFLKAFPESGTAGLVIKTQNADIDREGRARIKEYLAGRTNIFFIDGTLSRPDIYGLESVCDTFISLHRSEGFGFALAECMYLGKPVIATNWSGNVDFMTAGTGCLVDYELKKLEKDYGPYTRGQKWAEPNIDHAAWYMKKIVADDIFRRSIGLAASKHIRSTLSPREVGKLYRRRLAEIDRLF